jgi:D-glycero-alpha-D-manno-heptose-7-phosphate kinase
VEPYCGERGGAVLSSTINRFAYATVAPAGDTISARSVDYDASFRCPADDPFIYDGQLDLVKRAVDYFRATKCLTEGVDVFVHNDAPPGSGLGSSSAITVALLCALASESCVPLEKRELAELAYRIERIESGIVGGRQDQYASVFGGFNFIEFVDGKVVVNALRLPSETLWELEYSLVFGYLGGPRLSSRIIERQVENYRTGSQRAIDAMDNLKALAYEMKRALILGELNEFGDLLHQSWQCKKQMAEGITTDRIDEVYETARRAGALGGKIPGAGGGGYMIFYCQPGKLFAVQEALVKAGVELTHFSFTNYGATSWVVSDGGSGRMAIAIHQTDDDVG